MPQQNEPQNYPSRRHSFDASSNASGAASFHSRSGASAPYSGAPLQHSGGSVSGSAFRSDGVRSDGSASLSTGSTPRASHTPHVSGGSYGSYSRTSNSPHAARSSRSGNSSRGTSQRANVFNARDELERERELYSAHDPRQNALSPAQRYAQAKKEQDEANRQCYWSQHPEDAGRSGASSSRIRDAYSSDTRRDDSYGSDAYSDTRRSVTPYRTDGVSYGSDRTSNTPHVSGRRISDTPHISNRAGSISRAGNPYEAGAAAAGGVAGTGGYGAGVNSTNGTRVSRTPHIGEATLSGRIPRQAAPSESGRIPYQTAASASGRIPQQGSTTASANGRISRQGVPSPSASGRMPVQASPSASSEMPYVNGGQPAEQGNNQYTNHGASQAVSHTSRATSNASQTDSQVNQATAHASQTSAQQATYKRSVHSRAASEKATSNKAANFDDPTEHSSELIAENYLSANRPRPKMPRGLRMKIIGGVVVVAVVAAGIFGFTVWDANKAVAVTINGEQQTISGQQRSIEGLLDTNTVSVTPGNYVAVDGSVIRQGDGTRVTATINGEEEDDLSTHLNEGDDISVTNGTDIMEDYTESDSQLLQPSYELRGTGAVHLYTQQGEPGEKVVRTGKESGKTAEVVTKEPVNGVVQYYNVNTNGDKVIALTFDDGPWDSSTQAILDILKENDAKATFFTVGQKISGHEDLVKRAVDEGHEIGTHTWDHAEGSGQGVSLILMSSDERKQEVEKGMQAIKDATGQDGSLMFRSPGGNFDAGVAADLGGMITAEIGWNVDTHDWKRPGADVVAQRIESAGPGEILLMHDGGGDRTQTVEALRKALPVLKEQGYKFVTVSDLINSYPYQG